MRVKRAATYGFCSGVRVAEIKLRRFAASGGRGAILGQVVHNERVVADMETLGLRTVDHLEAIDEPTVIFSAHGVPPSVHRRARERGLEILDTTCTFVYDIHRESRRALKAGSHLVFIGDPDHREVVGYTHDLDPADFDVVASLEAAHAVDWSLHERITIFFQTTLNAEEFRAVVAHIRARNPRTRVADTICYATRENQRAARELSRDPEVDLVLVIGGASSANTRHLWEITSRHTTSHLIQDAADIDPHWLEGVSCIGLTAGASTPDTVVDEVEARLHELGG